MKRLSLFLALVFLIVPSLALGGNYLKQSTATTLKLGPFVDSTDGNTLEDSLTISQGDVKLSKNGGNFAQKNEASACTYDEGGFYDCDLNTTDTGTLGRLKVYVHESGALHVWEEYTVVTANHYDSMCSTDYKQVDVMQAEGSDYTDTVIGADGDTLEVLSDEIAALNDPTAASVADAVWDEVIVGAHDGANAAGALLDSPGDWATATGFSTHSATDVWELNISAYAGAGYAGTYLKDLYDNQGNWATATGFMPDTEDGSSFTLIPWNPAWDTEVESEVYDELVDQDLDHLMNVAVANNADMTAEITDGSVLSNMMSKTSDTSSYSVGDDSLEGISDAIVGGTNDWGTTEREQLRSALGLNGTKTTATGGQLQDIEDYVDTEVAATLSDTNEMQADLADGGRIDLILDELTSQGDTNEGKVDTVDTNVDTLVTRVPAEVAQKAHLVDGTGDITPPTNKGIWDSLGDGTALSTLTTSDNIGINLSDVSGTLDASEIGADAITGAKIATGAIGSDELDVDGSEFSLIPWNSNWDVEVESEVDDALGAGGADLTAVPWNSAWDTEVNAQMVDVVSVDTWSEFTQKADIDNTITDMLMLDFMKNRNKTETTSSEHRITNDAGTVILEQDLSDDTTTFEQSEVRDDN
ncbi:MAG: hypothetical protein GF334_13880 [Candidatus Altiarchaeales archaeon]|nr:hypothetical protein [Candidatus Altiarchaeales archaeon]